jgi:hypothetical protein
MIEDIGESAIVGSGEVFLVYRFYTKTTIKNSELYYETVDMTIVQLRMESLTIIKDFDVLKQLCTGVCP